MERQHFGELQSGNRGERANQQRVGQGEFVSSGRRRGEETWIGCEKKGRRAHGRREEDRGKKLSLKSYQLSERGHRFYVKNRGSGKTTCQFKRSNVLLKEKHEKAVGGCWGADGKRKIAVWGGLRELVCRLYHRTRGGLLGIATCKKTKDRTSTVGVGRRGYFEKDEVDKLR